MAHALERRAVIGQIAFGQRAERIRRFQAAPRLGVKIQRHAGAVRGFRQEQFFIQRARVHLSQAIDGAPVRDQKIVHIVRSGRRRTGVPADSAGRVTPRLRS